MQYTTHGATVYPCLTAFEFGELAMTARQSCYLLLINLLWAAPCFASPSHRLLSQQPRTASPQAASQPTNDDLSRYCLGLINNSRATEGHLQPVRQDSGLQRLAQSYADYMLK